MLDVTMAGLTLHVKDLERSLAFYKGMPGAVMRVYRPGQFAMLDFGGTRLGLLQENTGTFHIELEVDDLDALYEHFKQTGFPANAKPSVKEWGERDFLVIDPDGNVLEFGGANDHPDQGAVSWGQTAEN